MTVQDPFVKGVEAFRDGDMVEAERQFRACLAAAPDHAAALANLGILLLNRKAYGEAEPILERAAQLQPDKHGLTALAGLLDMTGRPGPAEHWYRRILEILPGDPSTLRRIAELHERHFNRPMARASYKKAWDAAPADVIAGIGYARTSLVDDPGESVRALEHLLAQYPDSPAKRLRILDELLVHKEWLERTRRNLMPQHAASTSDMYFPHCAPELAEYRGLSFTAADQNSNDIAALTRRILASICAREPAAAEQGLKLLHAKGAPAIWNAVTFDPAYYQGLENLPDTQLLKGLPPLLSVTAATFNDAPIAYLACDGRYFVQFAVPMLRSLCDKSNGPQVHIHIMDASDDQLREAAAFCATLPGLTVAMSAERPGVAGQGNDARAYYHAVRFIRFYQHLTAYGRPLWLMDVDALFNRDPAVMYRVLGGHDAAFRVRPGRLEPWNQFNASIVGAGPTPAAKSYFRLIAAYIADFYQRKALAWGIDQIAMYGVFQYLERQGRAPSLAFLDDRAIDYAYLDDGVVWCNSGKNKFAHLQRNPDGSLVVDDPDRARYLQLFDRYARAL